MKPTSQDFYLAALGYDRPGERIADTTAARPVWRARTARLAFGDACTLTHPYTGSRR